MSDVVETVLWRADVIEHDIVLAALDKHEISWSSNWQSLVLSSVSWQLQKVILRVKSSFAGIVLHSLRLSRYRTCFTGVVWDFLRLRNVMRLRVQQRRTWRADIRIDRLRRQRMDWTSSGFNDAAI